MKKEEISQTTKLTGGMEPLPVGVVSFEVALQDFYLELRDAVIEKAKSKGYFTEGEDSGRNLYDFIGKYAAGHSIGEIIYKVIRWTRKHDPEDLIKIAAWAFLTWDHNRRFPIDTRPTMAELQKILDGEMPPQGKNEEIKETAHVNSIPCVNCNFVRSAHKYDQVMDRYVCPIRKGVGTQEDPFMETYYRTRY